MRSDHGPPYAASYFEKPCPHWRIHHILAPVGRPKGNSVTERFIETIWTRDRETIPKLRRVIALWLKEYNHRRPYQALNWETPGECRAKNLSPPAELAA